MAEAFVYCWTDHRDAKLYVGYHKGVETDGYVSSSQSFNAVYESNPSAFSRQILSHGSTEDMVAFETAILTSVDAARSADFYNRQNGGLGFVCTGHNEVTRKKMSRTWKNKGTFNYDQKKAIETWRGQKHTDETRAKMSISRLKNSEAISQQMKSNNPMHDPIKVAQMLETRRRNKEARNGSANN